MCRFMTGIMATALSNAAAAQNMSTNVVRQPVDAEYRGQGHTVVFRTVSVVPVRMHDAFRGGGHHAVARSDTLRLSPADLRLPRGRTLRPPAVLPLSAPPLPAIQPDSDVSDRKALLEGAEEPILMENRSSEPSWGWLADEVFEAERSAEETVRARRAEEFQSLWRQFLDPFDEDRDGTRRQPAAGSSLPDRRNAGLLD
jgi:hypothetical protein